MIPAAAALIEAHHIEKRYGAVQALADATITLASARIHGLVGENGAGKSTLMRILADIEVPDGGTVREHRRSEERPLKRSIVPQYPRMAGTVPLWQNILLGCEPRFGPFIDRRAAKDLLTETTRRYAIDLDLNKPAGDLNGTELRLAALVAALARKPDLIILDEPTVGLATTDREAILRSLESLRADGLGILYISHDLNEVSRISDAVTVIREGRTLQTLSAPLSGETLADLMFGTAPPHIVDPARRNTREEDRSAGLRFDDTRIYDRWSDRSVGPLSFVAPPGEITAVTGIRESGLDLLERYLSGEARLLDGAVRVAGQRLASSITPADLRRQGAVFIPSDRFDTAAALDGSVEENAILQVRTRVHPGGIKTAHQSQGVTSSLLGRFGVSASMSVPLGALSGGTIQKLILARELDRPTPACIIAEPFAGLDLHSQNLLGTYLRQLAERNTAVLILSSTVESVVTLAHSVYVLTAGAISGPYHPEETLEISHAFAGSPGAKAEREDR